MDAARDELPRQRVALDDLSGAPLLQRETLRPECPDEPGYSRLSADERPGVRLAPVLDACRRDLECGKASAGESLHADGTEDTACRPHDKGLERPHVVFTDDE